MKRHQNRIGRDQQVPALTAHGVRDASRPRSRPNERRRWPCGLAAAVLFFCYWRQSQAVPLSSDGSGNVLQAWDMLHGNLLLHNWWVSDVSFYTTELPQYMLIEALTGLGPWVVHVAAAMTYTLLVLLAALLAKGNARGGAGLGPRPAGRGPDAVAPAQRHLDPAALAGPHRDRGARAGHLAADRSRPAALVRAGAGRPAVHLWRWWATRSSCSPASSRWCSSVRGAPSPG